uniref:Uncharacterized protein n=1 Tax=Solanum lycopersicum TaxID=4081 RepID=A0A3Q7J845_SOLLC
MGKYMPIKHLHCGSVKFFEMISTFDFDVGTRFSLPKKDGLEKCTHFRSLIGTLQYLAITRPDIQFAVNRVAQRMHQPSEHDYHCLKCFHRYIFGTLGRGLLIRPEDLELRGFSDSDWANDKNDRKSTSGIWGNHEVYKVSILKNRIVLAHFATIEGKNVLLQGGIYHFDSKPVIVKAWNPDMEFSKEVLSTFPIWVKLPDLEFKYWIMKGLSKIGSLICKPVMVYNHTENKMGLSLARLPIEVKMDPTLPEKVVLISRTAQPVTCHVNEMTLKASYLLTVANAFNTQDEKRSLWEYLEELSLGVNMPLIVTGDFNSVLKFEDRVGGN